MSPAWLRTALVFGVLTAVNPVPVMRRHRGALVAAPSRGAGGIAEHPVTMRTIARVESQGGQHAARYVTSIMG